QEAVSEGLGRKRGDSYAGAQARSGKSSRHPPRQKSVTRFQMIFLVLRDKRNTFKQSSINAEPKTHMHKYRYSYSLGKGQSNSVDTNTKKAITTTSPATIARAFVPVGRLELR